MLALAFIPGLLTVIIRTLSFLSDRSISDFYRHLRGRDKDGYTKPTAPRAASCFPFFSGTIPFGFGDLSSKIDFNSLGIKHSVLTLPSSCQSQKELNVVSEDFSIIPSNQLDGVLGCSNLS